MNVYYYITNFKTKESFKVQRTVKTVKDLKKELAKEFRISDDNLKIDQAQEFELIKEYSEYNFTISSFSDTTNFLISNKRIAIKNFNEATFEQIIERFKQEGFYYSDNCIREKMHFKICGNGKNEFDVIVELKGEFIQLYYDKKSFAFSDFYDNASDAYKLLNSVYGNVTILKSNSTKLNQNEELKIDEKYKIVINSKYGNPESANINNESVATKNQSQFHIDKQKNRGSILKEKNDDSPKSKEKHSISNPKEHYPPKSKKTEKDPISKDKNDYSPKSKETETINKIKESSKSCEIESNKDEGKNHNQKLKQKDHSLTAIKPEMNDSEKEDSDEKLLIIFVFDDKYKHYPLKKELSVNTTIEEIIQIITNECNIKDKIAIKYQEKDIKYEVDHEMTIDDIRDEMKEKIRGKMENILYVQPYQKKQQKNQKSKEIDLPKSENKTKKLRHNAEEDDDEVTHDKKKSSNNIIYYQVNSDPEIKEFKLEHDTTVKNMKEFIAEEYEIEDYNKIKIIFAGKELLDDLVLEKMNIGDIKLLVYFPTIDEILLLTAKALRVD